MVTQQKFRACSAEQRLKEASIPIPSPPERFGEYAGAV
jgi:hypothetical protein